MPRPRRDAPHTEVLLSGRTSPRVEVLYVVLERASGGEGVARHIHPRFGDLPWITDDGALADRLLAMARAAHPESADRLFLAVFARVEDVRTVRRHHPERET
jgi:hypothetical protein